MCLKELVLNVRLQGLQNSKSNHFFTPRAVPLYPGDTAFQRSL